jgi:adenylate kinase family enzyme
MAEGVGKGVKIHIIGIPSAGKTTLAGSMSRLLNLPHHDFDPLAFVDERWTLRGAPERDAMLSRILEESDFVSEGAFLGWTEPLFAAADHIIWLDPPLRMLIWRHVRRHYRRPFLLSSLLRFQVLMYLSRAERAPARFDANQTRKGIGIALRPWAYKVIRVRRSVTADELVAYLG